jgi:hypothetical protein
VRQLREQLAEKDRQHERDLAARDRERDAEVAQLKRDVAHRDAVIARFKSQARQQIIELERSVEEVDTLVLPQSQSSAAQAGRLFII